ncbi:MAG TPA: hypothetical protein DCF91_14210 [Porphyromonadaceae bacterium]|nr:hypothetical protein [Porphyromonadaceae bacterium]
MLSILIPTYNANCLPLVENIYSQVVELQIPFEILLADDASDESFRLLNRSIEQWEGCRYLQIDNNMGPARIRNFLADQAQFPYLLFLDSDVMPVTNWFIADYIAALGCNKAVCGGFVYQRESIPTNAILRFKYGIEVEEKSALVRSEHPYHSFISMNFLICRTAFLRVRFDESFHLGYEDTLFGIQLEEAGVPVAHIDNPVYHCVEESTEQFLIKIKRAVRNLIGHEQKMHNYVKLLKWHRFVKKLGMQPVFAYFFRKSELKIIANLTSPSPSLKLFAFYKLGYLCTLYTK